MRQDYSAARRLLVERLQQSAGLLPADAERVARYYIRLKIVSYDAQQGEYVVKHVRFYNPEIIREALRDVQDGAR